MLVSLVCGFATTAIFQGRQVKSEARWSWCRRLLLLLALMSKYRGMQETGLNKCLTQGDLAKEMRSNELILKKKMIEVYEGVHYVFTIFLNALKSLKEKNMLLVC